MNRLASFPGSRLGTHCTRGSRLANFPYNAAIATVHESSEAEPQGWCIPRQEPGNEIKIAAMQCIAGTPPYSSNNFRNTVCKIPPLR